MDSSLVINSITVTDGPLTVGGVSVATESYVQDQFNNRQIISSVATKADLLTLTGAQVGKLVRVTALPDVIWELIGTDPTLEANWSGRPETDAAGDLVGTIRVRAGTQADINAMVLDSGEIAAVTDLKTFRVGDGVTAGGIDYDPNSFKGVSVLVVNAMGTPGQNGAALYAADQLAGHMTPNGLPQSWTNRVTILISPGQYDLSLPGALGNLPNAACVSYIGAGSPVDTRIYSAANGRLILLRNSILKNLTFSSVNGFSNGCLNPSTGASENRYLVENCIIDGGPGPCIFAPFADMTASAERSIKNCVFKGSAVYLQSSSVVSNLFQITFDHCRFLAGFGTTTNAFGIQNCIFNYCTMEAPSNPGAFSRCSLYHCDFKVTGTDQTALFLKDVGTAPLRTEILHSTFIGTGAGKSIDAPAAVNYSIGLCALNLGIGSNVTNLLATPNNIALVL